MDSVIVATICICFGLKLKDKYGFFYTTRNQMLITSMIFVIHYTDWGNINVSIYFTWFS